MLRIPVANLSQQTIREIAQDLTLRLPDAGSYGFGAGGPSTLRVYKLEGDHLCVPRNWPGQGALGLGELTDRRSMGTPIGLKYLKTYREGQEAFIRTLLDGLEEDDRGAIGQAGCGFGKTVCATSVIARMDMTTLFVVHKEKLMKQFIEACEKFLNYTPGIVQGDSCDFHGKKICVGMIQSLHQRDYEPELYRHFGLVMVDECHRVSAPTFSAAIEKFHAHYRVGLTATPRRGDKMEPVFHWHLGDVEAVGRGKFLDCEVYMVNWDPMLKHGQWHFRGKPNLGKLITALSKDDARTDMICGLIAKSARAGRKSLVLSDRCAHLVEIRNRLQKMFARVGESYSAGIFAAGASKKMQRQREAALVADVTLGTWAMASEGLDVEEKDTVFFGTPKADVEQGCGRIRRLLEGKKVPFVIDIDDGVGFLTGFARKRIKFYNSRTVDKSPWRVKVVSRIAG